MAEIKFPVRADEQSRSMIRDGDGHYICDVYDPSWRDEAMQALNGYPKAVKALKTILAATDSKEAADFASDTLDDLGELDD